jgi:hypothetical protein
MEFSSLKIGYVPNCPNLSAPGDVRRFVNYATNRGINFEIANPLKKYDLVVLSEGADISIWKNYKKGLIVYDLIDSYLAIPRTNIKGCLRGLAKFITGQSRYLQLNHWSAIEWMCQRADAVICTTEEQRRDISQFCNNVHVILDSHSAVTNTFKNNYKANQPFRLVWEGLPQTLGSLEIIRPVLLKLSQRYPIELWLVTDPVQYRYLGRYWKTSSYIFTRRLFNNVNLFEWKQETASEVICSCDLAVIPIDLSDPFAYGKPENKLLLFWRMGMPVLTSASPAYTRAMSSVGLDMTCASTKDWELKLEIYLNDQVARMEAARLGQAYAKEYHSEEANLCMWDGLFKSLFEKRTEEANNYKVDSSLNRNESE